MAYVREDEILDSGSSEDDGFDDFDTRAVPVAELEVLPSRPFSFLLHELDPSVPHEPSNNRTSSQTFRAPPLPPPTTRRKPIQQPPSPSHLSSSSFILSRTYY